MTIENLVQSLEAERTSLRSKPNIGAAHRFAKAVEKLGYQDDRAVRAAGIRVGSLVRQAIDHYQAWLDTGAKDAAAMNNIGVLLCNLGWYRKARPWFTAALKLDPRDANIHENLRIVDIMMHKPEKSWHRTPGGLKRGRRTFLAYFDAHGM